VSSASILLEDGIHVTVERVGASLSFERCDEHREVESTRGYKENKKVLKSKKRIEKQIERLAIYISRLD